MTLNLATGSGKTAATLHLQHARLGQHRGAKRLWLEGKRLSDAGFKAGVRYQVAVQGDELRLRLTPAGDHKVSGTATRPVVDLKPEQLFAALGAVEVVEARFEKRQVLISILPGDRKAAARLVRLNARLAAGQTLRLGSLSHGGGVASDALLRGLGHTQLAFANEIDGSYVEQSLAHGPLSHGGMSVEADMRDIDADALPEVDVLEAGLPCVAASRAGRAKKHLAQPEDDAQVQGLVSAFLDIVRATRPAVVLLENVPEYAASSSAAEIRETLSRRGYVLHETQIDGSAFALEARNRWVLVAVTRGLDIDLDALVPTEARPAALGEVLDRRPSGWASTAAQDKRAAANAAKGNGFSRGRRLLTPEATSVPTLRRGYQKGGSCDVRIAHPTRPSTARLFSPAEHARIKGIPTQLVRGLSDKKAHEVLGQSVISPAFTALGALIRAAL